MAAAVWKYGLSPFVLYQGVHEHLHKLTLLCTGQQALPW